MSLNNEDLKKIGKLIKDNNKVIHIDMEKMFIVNNEMIFIELDKIKVQIASLKIDNTHFKKEFERIHDKIDRMMEMESEDFRSVAKDVEKLKEKLASI